MHTDVQREGGSGRSVAGCCIVLGGSEKKKKKRGGGGACLIHEKRTPRGWGGKGNSRATSASNEVLLDLFFRVELHQSS